MPLRNTIRHYLGASLVCVALSASGQYAPNQKPPLAFGVKVNAGVAGIANQNNYGQNEMDYQANLGYGGGISASWHLDPSNSMFIEATYQTSGQKYADNFKNNAFRKEIRYKMISVPVAFRHMLSPADAGYSGVGSGFKPHWYLIGGVQVDRIMSPEVDWYLNGTAVDFTTFVLEGGNPNSEEIVSMGAPSEDRELFAQWDLMFICGGGFRIQANPQTAFSLEARGGIGLTDLNADAWQLKNHRGVYGASRNMLLGLHAGVHFLLNPIQ